ncbi:hypothetical protein H1R20_g5721, partial [Candolleomyces eurysporus]
MASSPEAFALLVLADASLTSGGTRETGYLALECVTITHPGATSAQDRDVYLVLRVNTTETPLDPERIVQRSDTSGYRTYVFQGTPTDPVELTLSFKLPVPEGSNPAYLEDLETFEGILTQYHGDIRGAAPAQATSLSSVTPTGKPRSQGHIAIGGDTKNEQDLRGHLVMVDEKSGEVIGQVEDRFRIREDPIMHTRGHENDPVIIEVSEETGAESDAHALEAFARIVPPDQQNWITKSATVVSSAISLTTNLVVTTITAASNYYVNNSSPSPHHSRAATPAAAGDPSQGGTPPPLPPRPRALVFLTSESTKKGLNQVHAVSGEAVKVSAKTVKFIDNMIRRAIGAKPKRDRTAFLRAGQDPPAPVSPSPSTSSPKSAGLAPPPYAAGGSGGPTLPARRSTSPVPPPLPSRPLTTKDRVLISADLILSTIDHSTRQLINAGTQQVGKIVDHKYGPEAAESSVLMANTARNVGLVYVDLHGIGRRALLKRAGRTYIKSKLSSNRPMPSEVAPAGPSTPTGK